MNFPIPTTDDRDVWTVYLAPLWAATVYAADEIDLFTMLAQAPASPEELAERTGLNPRGLTAVLALLAALGFLVRRGGRYHPNDVGRNFMTPASQYYWGPIWKQRRRRLPDTDFVLAALRNGEKTDVRPWEAPDMSAEAAQSVADRMNSHSFPAALGAARNVPFGGIRRLLDVGGGGGCYSLVFAQEQPHLSCTIMDLPAMCAVLAGIIAERDDSGRVDTLARNMFAEPWPEGFDAIFMSNVLHDWGDETCEDLLARSFAALPSGGQVLLHEMLLDDDGTGPLIAASFSVLMLGTYGRQRSFAELEAMLVRAGFVDVTVIPTSVQFSVVSARKP